MKFHMMKIYSLNICHANYAIIHTYFEMYTTSKGTHKAHSDSLKKKYNITKRIKNNSAAFPHPKPFLKHYNTLLEQNTLLQHSRYSQEVEFSWRTEVCVYATEGEERENVIAVTVRQALI